MSFHLQRTIVTSRQIVAGVDLLDGMILNDDIA